MKGARGQASDEQHVDSSPGLSAPPSQERAKGVKSDSVEWLAVSLHSALRQLGHPGLHSTGVTPTASDAAEQEGLECHSKA